MEKTTTAIFSNTELIPSDVIQSPGGNQFEINSYFGGKNIYRLVSLDVKPTSQPLFIIMSKESIVSQKWVKVEKNVDIKSNIQQA